MSDVDFNFNDLLYGLAVAFAMAILGTPLVWRMLRGLGRGVRVAATTLCAIGAVALLSLLPPMLEPRMSETPLIAVLASAVFQILLLPFLFLLPKKAPLAPPRP